MARYTDQNITVFDKKMKQMLRGFNEISWTAKIGLSNQTNIKGQTNKKH